MTRTTSVLLSSLLILLLTSHLQAADGYRLDDRSTIYVVPAQRALDVRTDLTLEAWVKADQMSPAGGRILDKTLPGTQLGYMLDTHPGNSLRLLNATGMCRYRAELPADSWTHVVGIFSVSEQIMKLYVNGQEVAALDGEFQANGRSSAPLCVGADPTGDNRFRGWIKRAAIYNRALSSEEIKRRSEAAQPESLDGVLGEWLFTANPGREIKPIAGRLALVPLQSATAFTGALVGESAAPEAPLSLWYRTPATKWSEALPIGNGRLGAMVFGGLDVERIQFNDDTVWTGDPHEYQHEGAAKFLPQIRQLLYDGKQREAEGLAMSEFMSVPLRQMAYQPLADLQIEFPPQEAVRNYRRDLNLDTAVASVTYQVGDTTYQRQTFVSQPDQVLVWNMRGDRPGQVAFTVRFDSPHSLVEIEAKQDQYLVLNGQVEDGAIRFEARLAVQTQGGTATFEDNAIHVTGADQATLTLVAATNFKNYHDVSADPAERCAKAAAAIAGKDFDTLLAANLTDHQQLFRRVNLDLGSSPAAQLPTDQRLRQVTEQPDPQLESLYFQFGRYLLIASSRPGCQPANLQGIWNEQLQPPWDSKWTININTEMNYWPAEVCNLSECHEPLFDLIDDCAESGRKTAQAHYDCRGWVLHHNTDLWRGTAPINHSNHGIWVTGGAWLCQHLWEHYLFTRRQGVPGPTRLSGR